MINTAKTGKYIQTLRKKRSLSQKDIADKLGVSFQAVSKWENGENLPDSGILLDLADILDTTADKILSGGTIIMKKRKTVSIADIQDGFAAFEKFRMLIGEHSTFYQGAVEGINQKMNMDYTHYAADPKYREVLLAEAVIQYLIAGYTIDGNELRAFFPTEKYRRIILRYVEK